MLLYRVVLAVCALAAAVAAASPHATAQTPTASSGFGLAASLQDGQFDLLVPIWLGERLQIAPAIGYAMAEEGGSDLRLGIAPRYYLRKESLSPYVGLRLGALMAMPDSGSGTTDILVGGAFGGEYFLNQHFSLGVEAQLNATISDEKSARFGNPGKMNLNTGMAVMAAVYF